MNWAILKIGARLDITRIVPLVLLYAWIGSCISVQHLQ